MFKNVLVGVDGSANGRDAVALATRLTAPDGKLTLVHVHAGELQPLHATTPGLPAEERAASQRLLEDERSTAGVEAELVSVLASGAGSGLHHQAEDQRADLIVVGSCGRGVFGRVMLGDDTRAALNGAPCAVAIATRGFAERPSSIARVGVGFNGSIESRAALEAARGLVPEGERVKALEVVSIPTYAFTGLMPPTIGDSVDVVIAEATARMRELDGVDGRAIYGLTGEELAAFGDDLDLLVVGSRSYGPVRRFVAGSTSDYLERHARCSLLVLPREAARAQAPGEEREAVAVAGAAG